MSFSGGTASSELGEASVEPWISSQGRLFFSIRCSTEGTYIPVSRGYHTYSFMYVHIMSLLIPI